MIKAKQSYGKIFGVVGHDEPLHNIINARGKFSTSTAAATWSVRGARGRCESNSPSKTAAPHGARGGLLLELPNVGAKLRIKARSGST